MKKILTAIHLVIIFFTIDFAVSAFYDYTTARIETTDYSVNTAINPQKEQQKNFHEQSFYNVVAKRDLFKTKTLEKEKKKPAPKPKKKKTEKIKLTDLKLELKGTITGTGSEPLAVIRKKGKRKQMLYAKGDTIDRAVIEAVLKRKVILLVDGEKETLLMSRPGSERGSNNNSPANTKVSSVGTKEGFVENVQLTWSDINQFRKNRKNLIRQVRIRPHFHKNKMDGFRITGVRENSVFYKKLGLRNGDIVAAVNDKKMRSIRDAVNFYKDFSKTKESAMANVDVKRNGKTGKIKYSIQ